MGALITTPDILPLAPSLYNPTHGVLNYTSLSIILTNNLSFQTFQLKQRVL